MSQIRGVSYAMAGIQQAPGARFSVADSVYVLDGDAGGAESKPVYRADTDEIRKNRRLPSISLRTAALILAVFLTVLAGMILSNAVKKAELTKQIDSTTASIAQAVKDNYALSIQVVSARDSTRISYKAVQELGMISAEGAETYYVTAPETRQTARQDLSLPGTQSASLGSR